MTELLLKRKYMRHISHCRLVSAVSSHGVTHCARCRLVCYIVPPRMHTLCYPFLPARSFYICFLSSVNKRFFLLRVSAQLIGDE